MSRLRRLVPSLNALFTFEAVVRCGTFAKAAEELGVTGPAVSRTIARLESYLGVGLFHRTGRGAVLTDVGEMLYDGIAESFVGIEKALLRIQAKRSDVKTIVLSASSAFVTHWFMPRLASFQSHFPKVDIRFQLINGPLAGPVDDVDIAMRFDFPGDSRHIIRPLMPEILLPIHASHYDTRGNTTAGAFMPAVNRIINLSAAQPDWSELFSHAAPGQAANPLVFSDYAVVVQAALLGQGVALGWLNVVSYQLAQGNLFPSGFAAMVTGRMCQLITTRNGPAEPVTSQVCDWIASEFSSDMAILDDLYPDLRLGLLSDPFAAAPKEAPPPAAPPPAA